MMFVLLIIFTEMKEYLPESVSIFKDFSSFSSENNVFGVKHLTETEAFVCGTFIFLSFNKYIDLFIINRQTLLFFFLLCF